MAAVGAKAAASMETMKSMCNAGKGHAGDGTCNILEIPAYQDQLKGRKPGAAFQPLTYVDLFARCCAMGRGYAPVLCSRTCF